MKRGYLPVISLKTRLLMVIGGLVLVMVVAILYLHRHTFAVLQPAGPVAGHQKQLIVVTAILSLVVVIPVFTMLFAIAWKYRETNHKAIYTPNWDRSRLAETIWWTVPALLIAVIGVITWSSSHQLDPAAALSSPNKPVTIQVVALNWKWLFIYPDQNIATVNYIQIPVNTPINFEITSDAAMNSFWLPQLGGQIYAMQGMSTQLHLSADHVGSYRGSSANISGAGFAGMKFIAQATDAQSFDNWVQTVQDSSQTLTQASYQQLAKNSQNNPRSYYASTTSGLYDSIINKYMGSHGNHMQQLSYEQASL